MRSAAQGYIAFTSAVIISSVLLALAVAGSVRGWYVRSNVLDKEFKLRSEALADTCVQQTLLKIAKDPTFTGGVSVEFEDGACILSSVITIGTEQKFTVSAEYRGAHTKLRVTIGKDLQVTYLEELST